MNSNVKAFLSIVIVAVLFTSCQATLEMTYSGYDTYDSSDETLAALPAGTNQAVFIGASGIYNWASLFSFNPGKPYVNRGIAGQTIGKVLMRFRHDVLDLNPDYAVVWGGDTNLVGGDSTQFVFEQLKSITEVSRANGVIPVLCALTPVCGDTLPVQEPLAVILQLNSMIQSYCTTTGLCLYADFYTPLADSSTGLLNSDYSYDCSSPNGDGYNLLNTVIQTIIDNDVAARAGN